MNKRLRITVIAIALFVLFTDFLAVGTIAYLKRFESRTNDFAIGTIIPKIMATFDEDNNIKENIHIYNDGNYPIFVRVRPVYYFKNNNGELLKDIPVVNTDYSIVFSSSGNWIKGNDGYYYYKQILNKGTITDNLIDTCSEIKNNVEKIFYLDIVAQAIQAFPSKAIEEAWGITVVDDIIQIN